MNCVHTAIPSAVERAETAQIHRGALRLRELRKHFGPVVAVDGIDLQVDDEEFVTLLGPSGSGKTTTLAMIAGFERPDGGRIQLDERDITHVPPHKRGIGVVFQNYALFPHLTVAENVGFSLRMRGWKRRQIGRKVEAALELVQLSGLEERYPRELSGGQQQRVAVARATVFGPGLLLMDEPLGALDRKLRDDLQVEIRRLHRDLGTTIVYVTHDQDEALALSDRIALMNEGGIVQVGTAEAVYERPASLFAARFLGQSNLLFGTVEIIDGRDIATVALSNGTLIRCAAVSGVRAGERAAVLIRPERVRLVDEPRPDGLEAVAVTVADTIYLGGKIQCRGRFATGEEFIGAVAPGEGSTLQRSERLSAAWSPVDAVLIPLST